MAADTCATAPTIVGGYTLFANMGDFSSSQSLTSSSCAQQSTSGSDFFHKIVVPAGQKLLVESLSLNSQAHSVYFYDDCMNAEGSCVAGKRISFGAQDYQDTVEWINDTGAAKTLVVGVDNSFSSTGLYAINFDLIAPDCTAAGASVCDGNIRVTCGNNLFTQRYTCSSTCGVTTPGQCDNPNGDSCSEAFVLAGASGSVAGTYAGATNQSELPTGVSGTCSVFSGDNTDGPDVFYSVVLQSQETLKATVTGGGSTVAPLNQHQLCRSGWELPE